MNVAVRRPQMSMDEFLAWEIQQEGRWEFDGFEPRAMVGASVGHHRIVSTFATALRDRLQGRCLVVTETVKLRLNPTVRYPDVMVICSEIPNDATSVGDPLVVAEVLSNSTARDDRIVKNREYEGNPSIQRYIVLEQDVMAAEVYSRIDGRWVRSTVVNDDILDMPEIGISLPLSAAYVGLDVPPYVPTLQDTPDHA
ncbi:MAG TPA: Uma2 family endonuclease [Acetobacteraceae bacterium]|nr:Uma2 family endonuclease [Acetobacteraceae bacterium]